MDAARKNKILYWVFTVLFGAPTLAGGIFYFSGAKEVVEAITHLGYPLYLLKILGAAKILGMAAILVNRFATLKEWAYAGFAINFAGASASHVFAGDPVINVVSPLFFLALMFGSYFCWKKLPRAV
jgi:hypothetical protein